MIIRSSLHDMRGSLFNFSKMIISFDDDDEFHRFSTRVLECKHDIAVRIKVNTMAKIYLGLGE